MQQQTPPQLWTAGAHSRKAHQEADWPKCLQEQRLPVTTGNRLRHPCHRPSTRFSRSVRLRLTGI